MIGIVPLFIDSLSEFINHFEGNNKKHIDALIVERDRENQTQNLNAKSQEIRQLHLEMLKMKQPLLDYSKVSSFYKDLALQQDLSITDAMKLPRLEPEFVNTTQGGLAHVFPPSKKKSPSYQKS